MGQANGKREQISEFYRFFTSTPIETSDPASISEMSEAANNFGSPAEYAIQPTAARQVNTAAKKTVHPNAAIQAQAKPRSINKPHAAESAPKVPPDIRAVFAPEGFDKKPASPQRIKKTPNPINQYPLVFITGEIHRRTRRQFQAGGGHGFFVVKIKARYSSEMGSDIAGSVSLRFLR
jgi:hypothetical protein